MPRKIWNLGLIVASSFNYAGACLLVIIWNLNLFYYLPIIFVITFLIGFLVVDVGRSVIYTYVCLIIGHTIAVTIFLAPYLVFSESVGRVNAAVMVVLNTVFKVFLITAVIPFFGAMLGCFLGEKTLEPIAI